MATCTRCGETKPPTEFYTDPRKKAGHHSQCKECVKTLRRDKYATPEGRAKIRASNTRHWRNHKEQYIEAGRRVRRQVLAEYGGRCACCGEDHPEFLGIDHIYSDGEAHRREMTGYGRAIYRWLKKNGFPKDRFQLLCHNCNMAKGLYGGCPHGTVAGSYIRQQPLELSQGLTPSRANVPAATAS